MEIERLGPIMNALAEGIETDASPADVARAGRLLVVHDGDKAGVEWEALLNSLHARKDMADDYGNGYDLHSLAEAMATYRVPGLVIGEP